MKMMNSLMMTMMRKEDGAEFSTTFLLTKVHKRDQS